MTIFNEKMSTRETDHAFIVATMNVTSEERKRIYEEYCKVIDVIIDKESAKAEEDFKKA